MLTKLTGGRLFDPANGRHGEVEDLWLHDDRVVADPGPGAIPDAVHDVTGKVVMAGAIDIHSHIAGGKVNLARLLMGEEHEQHRFAGHACGCDRIGGGSGIATPSTHTTGARYIEMGFTAAFEPAMLGSNARHAHLEMSDIPYIDTGGYLVLGNDDFLLDLIATNAGQAAVNDYVAWMLTATQSLAVKVVNPGGINAFKFNARTLDLDEAGPHYGVTPRSVLTVLARAVYELGLPHPLHVHGCNLGVPGNVATTLDTIQAASGLPMHMTHIQFHSYDTAGDRKFSSGAAALAEAINRTPTLSVDIGQVMFGQTVTASADTMAQRHTAPLAHPRKWLAMDIECDAGCGVVPFRYRDKSYVNALQWAIGLELFLLLDDPWRVFLTTDHPNGAPFTFYPELIRLLMDRDYRLAKLAEIHPDAPANTTLGSIAREYTLAEIAVMTRAAPARILGLADRGHLAPGASADVTVYSDLPDRRAMFERPDLVFKSGRLVVRDGALVAMARGCTHVVRPGFDDLIERRIARHFDERIGLPIKHFRIRDAEIRHGAGPQLHPCRRREVP
ncbi:formylmethanofuran dehydrogenase subunit A [Azospirillum lipoferum]|uniref:Formylmethanofuran dehydrogenase subunit A n=1 Tax=Azospirillum lipoferum TaxID=193 RepID=A0A5A9G771_AZOLI|nr:MULTISPECIES: formylmethanofuran dehydrogenase subunit A [Azospirillum]KAA0589119.1 formylmethanofuran dehydrogenase subunit A [Azospirillum lipoferum]MCP1613436.1 formylmethanofuran dehydrogenase subunit A [Azospirillum lipoferum]MDW5533128.1 formylmethanofuran dehydrogenase subunit A [Azospirillum sp. NL1]